MKKLYIILALVVVSILMVFAGDTIKILRVYHNGTYTAIPLANIDSIDHSRFDANGKLQPNYASIIKTLDSSCNIPISETDSVVITEADVDDYNQYTEEIRQYLVNLEELPIDKYQEELLEWINHLDYVSKATVSKAKDEITVEFLNGLDFYINFIELYKFSEEGKGNTARARAEETGPDAIKYFDVSSLFQEDITNPNILYIQGRTMPTKWGELNFKSNAKKEWEELNNVHQNSPVNGKLEKISKSFSFINEDFSNYGFVIISQTHGNGKGEFQVEDEPTLWLKEKVKKGTNVYIYQSDGNLICYTDEEESFVYWFNAGYMKNKIYDNIIYGSYCYSSDLFRKLSNATIYGYKTFMWYGYGIPRETPGKDSLIIRADRLLNGLAFKDAVWLDSYYVNDDLQVPEINNPNSNQRFFSIHTNNIDAKKGITGEIKGYKNLKTKDNADLKNKNDIITKWVLYAHEGTSKFTPKDNNVKRIEGAYIPDANGNFTISSDIVRQYPNHQFLVGFEYADKVYYGRVSEISVSIEDISPVCDNFEVIIKGKVNGYEKLRTKDVSLYVCKSKEVISNYSQSLNYQDFKYEYYKSFTAYLDEKNGNIECRVRRDNFDANTIYSFAFVLDNGGTYYNSDTKYCIWKLCPDNNHPHSIDLGLPGGILWACCNVASNPNSQKPEDYGSYYAWGETEEKGVYFNDTYNYYDEEVCNSSYHYIHIGNNISGTRYDAARTNWGASWRMPTVKEFKTLGDCDENSVSINGVDGTLFIGSNGNSIFIPYAGKRWKNELEDKNKWGYYWTATLQDQRSAWWDMYWKESSAYYANVTHSYLSVAGWPSGDRIEGLSIRPICNGEAPTDLCLSENNLSMNTKDNKIIDISSGSGDYAVTNSNPEVLSVTLNGNEVVITALSAGEATITVTDNQTGQTTSLIVSVSGESNKLSLSRSSLSDLGVGNVATVYIESGNGDYIVESDNNKIATATLIGSSIIIKALSVGTATITISDKQSGQTATINVNVIQSDGPTVYRNCPDSNHPHMIDIGLSTKWACCNVGASNPNDYGCYFAWGETDVKSAYETNNYLYADEDVATVLWGDNWKMPTYNQIYELIYTCTSEVTKGGRWFTGPNGRSIFFPAAGNRFLGVHNDEDHGHYWTGTLFPDDKNLAYILYFGLGDGNDGVTWRFANRSYGLSVRPVAK